MKSCEKYNRGKGMALIIILLLVAAIMVISLGFIVRGDTELLCGQNMEMKADMDYLAESGLEHAKGLILNPQDVQTDYWPGATGQQLNTGSNDYYDVTISQLSSFNYQITSLAYRENGGQRTAQNSLTAELRLNPCIVYWQSGNQDIPSEVNITGDAYFGDNVTNYGKIYGDVYSAKIATSIPRDKIVGQIYDWNAPPVNVPPILYSNFSSVYYIGSDSYPVVDWPAGDGDKVLTGVYYCKGSLVIDSNVFVNGTLVVETDLKLKGGKLTIQSVKNFPALIIGHDLLIEDPNDPNAPNNRSSMLTATGYTQIGNSATRTGNIDMQNTSGSSVKVYGALYIFGGGIVNTTGCTVDISGMPHKASLAIWSSGGNLTRWSPAGGAFYKSIKRIEN